MRGSVPARVVAGLAALLAATLPVCVRAVEWPRAGHIQPVGPAPSIDSSLKARVDAWWKAREERDHQTMYELFDPEYRRTTPFSKFLQESAVRTRFDIVSHRIERVEARGENRVVVFLEIGSAVRQFGGPFPLVVDEPWVRVDGEWFKVHEEYRPPFPHTPPR